MPDTTDTTESAETEYSDSDEWQLLFDTKPSAERLAKYLAIYENRRILARYERERDSWEANVFDNGKALRLPIPGLKVNGVVLESYPRWNVDVIPTDDLITPMWLPSVRMRSKMTQKQLKVAGLTRPPAPPSGVQRVGPYLGDGRYMVLSGDTVEVGEEIEHNGLTLLKFAGQPTPFGVPIWYQVVT